MQNLSKSARLYIIAAILAGGVLAVWYLGALRFQHVGTLALAAALATLFQIQKIEGATARSSYNLSWVIYGATFTALGVPETLLVILIAHLVEWVWHRYPWYIQTFNIASFAVTTAVADASYRLVYSIPIDGAEFRNAVAILAALLAFTLVNHLLVGLVIKLARGQSLAQSGVFELTPLTIDFGLLCLGTGAAFVARISPVAVIFMAIVAYLLQTALRVPALERKSASDAKTGLYNAAHFEEAVEKELQRAQKLERPLSMVMADLDLLRDINNTYGHLAGDAVLKKVAQILQALARESDLVARFGGEEFGILMPNTTPAEALVQTEAMRKAIEAAEFTVPTSAAPIKATMSFGIAGRERQAESAKAFIHNADLAVYQAKHDGRNCVRVYSSAAPAAGPSVLEKPLPAAAQPPAAGAIPAPEPSAARAAPPNPSKPSSPIGDDAGGHAAPAAGMAAASSKYVNYYVAAAATAAVGLILYFLPPGITPDWLGLAVFALLALALEFISTDIYTRDTSVSTSVAPLIAATLAFGISGALLVSLVITLVTQIKHRAPSNRVIFNASNHLLGALLCLVPLRLANVSILDAAMPAQLLYTLLSAAIIYLSTTALLAGVVSLNTGERFEDIWQERFKWLGLHYGALGLVAYALLYSYLLTGVVGVIVLLVPLSMIHLSQRQYVKATKTMVDQLRKTNSELLAKAAEINTLNDELFLALASTIDLRDPYVIEHSRHVARYAALTAAELGLPPERVELIYQAGLMHDIGKLAIPEAILFKPDRLTADEYAVIKDHVVIGADLLGDFRALQRIATFVRHHHERYDGRGYPDHLAGDAIPLEARILALADAVEAMASDRPYRQGSPAEAILAEIEQQAGGQFDPEVVRAFLQAVQRQGASIIANSARAVHPEPSEPTSPLFDGLAAWSALQAQNSRKVDYTG
jgi:diguanylate cyclase (GGDEF)-like protein/putative nucleotidyltransferase with HDIG domain